MTGGDYLNGDGETVEHSYQLNYDAVFTYAVGAIQELTNQVKTLQARLDAAGILKKKILPFLKNSREKRFWVCVTSRSWKCCTVLPCYTS